MEDDARIVVLLADIGTFSFAEAFKRWPERCMNTACTEFGTVNLATGLAKSGLIPIVSTIASFLVRRAYEALYIHGMNDLPGLFVSVGADGYPGLGRSHSAPEDVLLMRQIPGMAIRTPTTAIGVDTCIREAVTPATLTYVRLGNG